MNTEKTTASGWVLSLVRFGNKLERLAYLIGCVAICVFFMSVFLNVLFREFFTPLMWAEEVSRFGYVWAIFLGAGVAMRHARHFTIDIVVNLLGAAMRRWLDLFKILVIMVFAGVLFLYSVEFAQMSIQRTSFPSGIPFIWATASIPVGAVFLIYFMVEQLALFVSGLSLDEAHQMLKEAAS